MSGFPRRLAVIPAWMFDEIICARVRCDERPTVNCRALLSLAHFLESARPTETAVRVLVIGIPVRMLAVV
jgi:hypothetical protein